YLKLPQPSAQSCCNCVTQANACRHLRHALCSLCPISARHPRSRGGLLLTCCEHAHVHIKSASKSRLTSCDWFFRLYYDYVTVFVVEDEIYDKVVDLTEYAKRQRWWNRLFGKNSGPIAEKYSVATQIAIGGVSGWCAGYLFQKVGKVAATAVGGGLLLLQVANNSGYIQVDWKRVEKDVNKAKKQLKKGTDQAVPELNTFVEKSREFVKKNIVVTSGFIGGFLLGLAS
uniref:FUN14 domain-containing protein 2 n=1 Tax=Oreochromis aureus TaxID=47969 RepID=A0AAZ1WYQ8_OREAU